MHGLIVLHGLGVLPTHPVARLLYTHIMTSPRYLTTDNNWPDWQDAGKSIQVIMVSGECIDGVLRVDDVFFADDEIPIFVIEQDDGVSVSFCDVSQYRFI
jgi:hypothetical protein